MGPMTVRSDAVFDGVTQGIPQVQYASVNLSASGDLVAAVTGQRIRVLGLVLVASASATIKLQTGAATDLCAAMSLIAGTPLVLPTVPHGYTQTAVGAKLNAVVVGTVQISGFLIYVVV